MYCPVCEKDLEFWGLRKKYWGVILIEVQRSGKQLLMTHPLEHMNIFHSAVRSRKGEAHIPKL